MLTFREQPRQTVPSPTVTDPTGAVGAGVGPAVDGVILGTRVGVGHGGELIPRPDRGPWGPGLSGQPSSLEEFCLSSDSHK